MHCHGCGGFIGGDPQDVVYRLPADTVLLVAPHSGLCACEPPVLYESPPVSRRASEGSNARNNGR